jgi:cytochrome c biogenesis protein CcmG/thiol:disulfide interchange protein DsbE
MREEIRQSNPNTIEFLLGKYPEDFWIQRRYIDLKTGIPYASSMNSGMPTSKVDESVIARFQKAYENNPDNAQSAYLYAYALIHTDTAKSVKILTSLTTNSPSFSAAWMTLGVLHGYANFRDQKKQQECVEAFLRLCPDSAEPRITILAQQLVKSDVLISYIRNLRERVAGKEDRDLLPLYYYLWRLELKFASPDELTGVKKRIKDDLKFIEGLDRSKFMTAQSLLIQGYEQIGDKAGLENLLKSNPQLASSNGTLLFYQAMTDWSRTNPAPPPAASMEEQRDYFRKQLRFFDEWQSRVSDVMPLLEQRFRTLASLPETTEEALSHGGDRILLLAYRARSSGYIQSAMKVLETWAERGISLDRIPSIVEQLRSSQSQTQPNPMFKVQSDIMESTTDSRLLEENQQWAIVTSADHALVTVCAKTKQFDQARSILAEWEKALQERRKRAEEIRTRQIEQLRKAMASDPANRPRNPLNYAETAIVQGLPYDEAKYYDACAKLAEEEGRRLDALAFYQTSLRMLNGSPPARDTLVDIADRKAAADLLWKELGGTQKGWEAWNKLIPGGSATPLPPVPRQAVTSRPIPSFSLPDQHGKVWTLTSLKGKTTLLNVWATWCGPCRNELPHIQKLHEQLKNRSDIQVVTLNIDEDRSQVEPFLKKNNFSFPSLYANSFVKDFAGSIGIPTTWIVDAFGTIRSESLGFGGSGYQWLEQTLKQLESVSKGSK